mmetsp:Transcript_26398/g.67351  ORF Transcript_26398/g.67351 Transcript_26398/m.67351 type:complete len:785 (-) Transcript_26398:373-2727(-)
MAEVEEFAIKEIEDFQDHYELAGEIARGGFGEVRRCRSRQDGREYAVKFLFRQDVDVEGRRIFNRIGNDYIVQPVEILKDRNNRLYIIMELASGGELFDRIVGNAFTDERKAARVILKIARALDHLHKRGIAHFDVKPENIIFDSPGVDGTLKLCDFGFAQRLRDGRLERLPYRIGTTHYMAPEVVRMRNVGMEADMWSLGVVMYMMFAKRFPFFADQSRGAAIANRQIESKILLGQYAFPRNVVLSTSAESLVRGLLEVDQAKRLTAEQVLKHEWLAENELASPNPRPAIPLHEGRDVGDHPLYAMFRNLHSETVLFPDIDASESGDKGVQQCITLALSSDPKEQERGVTEMVNLAAGTRGREYPDKLMIAGALHALAKVCQKSESAEAQRLAAITVMHLANLGEAYQVQIVASEPNILESLSKIAMNPNMRESVRRHASRSLAVLMKTPFHLEPAKECGVVEAVLQLCVARIAEFRKDAAAAIQTFTSSPDCALLIVNFLNDRVSAGGGDAITAHRYIGGVLADVTAESAPAQMLVDAGVLEVVLRLAQSTDTVVQRWAAVVIGSLAKAPLARVQLVGQLNVNEALSALSSSEDPQTAFAATWALSTLNGNERTGEGVLNYDRSQCIKISEDGKTIRNDSNSMQTVFFSVPGGFIPDGRSAFFEVKVMEAIEVRLGFVKASTRHSLPPNGIGGKDPSSWSVDPFHPYRRTLKAGDILSALLHERNLSCLQSARDLGVAFDGVSDQDGLLPAISLLPHQQVYVNFGQAPFTCCPQDVDTYPME